jgi:predicted transposase/invertase (TIGR01784 family)
MKAIFKLWHEKEFISNKEKVIFFLIYVAYTRDIPLEQLGKTLEECKIEGGDMMQTLARQLKKEEKIETAKRMLLNDFSVEQVITVTGLTEKEVKALMN